MSALNDLYLVKNTKTGRYESGYGRCSTPMLYSKTAAFSVAGKFNEKWNCTDYVAVPVEIKEKQS